MLCMCVPGHAMSCVSLAMPCHVIKHLNTFSLKVVEDDEAKLPEMWAR